MAGRNKSKDSISRRDLLKGVVGAGLTASLAPLSGCVGTSTTSAPRRDLIGAENRKPGTTDWLLTRTRVDPKTRYRCPWIEGYCSHTSIHAGETLRIFVSTNPSAKFTIDFYRLGFYGGTGGRQVHQLGPLPGVPQPDPPIAGKRLRDCAWDACAELKIPADWLSGVYLGKLTEGREGLQSYIVFIVRDDRRADYLFQCSD